MVDKMSETNESNRKKLQYLEQQWRKKSSDAENLEKKASCLEKGLIERERMEEVNEEKEIQKFT